MSALVVGLAACDEDRADPVQVTQQQPATEAQQPASHVGPGDQGRNPISGHRRSGIGKSLDVGEDLRDQKIPEYNRRLEEEANPNKR